MYPVKYFVRSISAAAVALAVTAPASAADEVNVGFFLEWATPNLIAKAEKRYEEEVGVDINWVDFGTGTAMTEAMLSGDIDISYSQGLAPFITAINADAPIQTVAIAVEYPANPCIVGNDQGIDSSNANELEGKTVAVPVATMADYSFRMMMSELGVDVSKITIVDQDPTDGVVSLADGNVAMACLFGGNTVNSALEVGQKIMSDEETAAAGIVAFDVVSVTDKFLQENPDQLKAFLKVTDDINKEFAGDQSKLSVISMESGMDEEATIGQMGDMKFPTAEEQMEKYFSEGGLAETAFSVVGGAFATDERPAKDDYKAYINTDFLN